jgi:transmembrane sensor
MSHAQDDLWKAAMALLLRWQSAPDDDRVRDEIRRFCAQGDAHTAAWESAKRLYRLTGDATGATAREQSRRHRRELTRRGVVAGIGALVVGTGIVKGPDIWRRGQADMVSDVGVIAEHRLADGTKLTLGPDSAVQIAFTPEVRVVTLLDGMALFDVAADPRRSFEARSGDFIARAGAGTSFEVRQNSGRSLVGVGDGDISVVRDGDPSGSALASGDWMARGPDGSDPQSGRREPGQVAAWRNRQLIANEDRIDAVVAEIARWQSARVVIADWGLAASRVSGLYDLRDPLAALEAVVSPYGGRVRRLTPWLTVLSSV